MCTCSRRGISRPIIRSPLDLRRRLSHPPFVLRITPLTHRHRYYPVGCIVVVVVVSGGIEGGIEHTYM